VSVDRLTKSPIFVIASVALVAGVLYLGQAFFVPLALALLLAFVLAPVVSWIERIGLGRTPAVIAVSVVIALLLAGMVAVASRELVSLVAEVPEYRENVVRKVKSLRGPLGSVERAADAVTELEEEIASPAAGERKAAKKPAPKVEVVSSSGLVSTLGAFVGPLLDPLGVIALVVVLAIFMLLQHEDLRDRVIRLAGGQDLSLTTHALDDAGTRIGRYLGMQSLLSVIHGSVIAGGLALIGIPSAILWGVLAAFMRFVPYVGPWIAAILPIAVAVGAFDSWTPAFLTIGLIVTLELLSNNVLEPWLFGSSVGLSPFAIIVSAVFWSWLWGLPGLLLATPLSACLVVLGRYVPGLEFLLVLLSDEPALEPDVRLYQRLLSRDFEEAEAILREIREDDDLDPDFASDRLVLPALRRLADSRARGTLSADLDAEVHTGFAELLEELAEETPESKENEADSAARPQVLCVPALGASDELASEWVARVLRERGTRAITVSSDSLLDPGIPPALAVSSLLVCISALTPAGERRARILAKRLSALQPGREIVIGAWAAPVQQASDPQRRIARITELLDRIRIRS
jgi:predicted PurR-regulated permease PerM